jgi:hypothetical protein
VAVTASAAATFGGSPPAVLKAIDTADEGNCYLFWNGVSKLKTCITEWQERLKKVSVIAGIEGGDSRTVVGPLFQSSC